jgi:hypothetical protein
MWDATGARVTTLDIRGLQLPQLLRVGVSLGEPEDLTVAASAGTPPKRRVPVPVLPVGC